MDETTRRSTASLLETDALVEQARQSVGAAPGAPMTGRDPVNRPMIHHWCQVFGDRNPAYLDPEVAAATRHGGIVAPPAMLGTWTLDADHRDAGGPRDRALRLLERAGFTAVVATDYEHEYLREVRPGDHLRERLSVEELSERKDTALGTGYFVTVRHDYHDQHGDLVGIARMRLLKFRPRQQPGGASDAAAGSPRRPRPPVNRDNAFFWEGVERGELLIQRCASCATLRHPPRPMCGACGSTDWDTVASAGRGTVHSYAVHHHPPLPGFELPHPIMLVDLDEGVRFVSHLTATPIDRLAVGVPVEVVFERVEEDLVLPLFRIRDQT